MKVPSFFVMKINIKSLTPFEQRFVIPQQIRIAKKTVARMRAKEHEHD